MHAQEQRLGPARFPRLVVGVVEPQPRVAADTPFDSPDKAIEMSVALIRVLRGTGYFAEVDFARQLGANADVLVTISRESGSENSNAGPINGLLWVGTYFLFPFITSNSETIAFDARSPTTADSTSILVRSKEVIVAGWVALVLLPLPGWRIPEGLESQAIYRMKLALLDHQAEFELIAAQASDP